jgi:hypothetical protein
MMMTLLQWRIQHWITHLKRTTVRFVGHKIKLNEGKGAPVVTLLATWKGYPTEEKPTVEKWGAMKKCHSRQLKRYVKRTEELRKVVKTYQLFNKLKKK